MATCTHKDTLIKDTLITFNSINDKKTASRIYSTLMDLFTEKDF